MFGKNNIKHFKANAAPNHFNDVEAKLSFMALLSNLTRANKCRIIGFLIVPDHVELIWQTANEFDYHEVEFELLERYSELAKTMIWEGSNNSDLYCRQEIEKRLKHMHQLPVNEYHLSDDAISYIYSSAKCYEFKGTDFDFLTYYVPECNCGSCW